MDSNEQDLENQILLKRLDDPSVNKWEKAKIRNKLGIYLELTIADFDKPQDKNFSTFFYDYIGDHIDRLKKSNSPVTFENLPDNIKFIYFMWGFSSIFESDGFRDYSENSLKEYEKRNGYSLRSDKTYILNGLDSLELTEDKKLLEDIWSKSENITDEEIEQLQSRFWNVDYKADFQNRLINLIKSSRTELLEFQSI